MADYRLLESGDRRVLEDGSGFRLLETVPEVLGRAVRVAWQAVARRTKWRIARRVKWR